MEIRRCAFSSQPLPPLPLVPQPLPHTLFLSSLFVLLQASSSLRASIFLFPVLPVSFSFTAVAFFMRYFIPQASLSSLPPPCLFLLILFQTSSSLRVSIFLQLMSLVLPVPFPFTAQSPVPFSCVIVVGEHSCEVGVQA